MKNFYHEGIRFIPSHMNGINSKFVDCIALPESTETQVNVSKLLWSRDILFAGLLEENIDDGFVIANLPCVQETSDIPKEYDVRWSIMPKDTAYELLIDGIHNGLQYTHNISESFDTINGSYHINVNIIAAFDSNWDGDSHVPSFVMNVDIDGVNLQKLKKHDIQAYKHILLGISSVKYAILEWMWPLSNEFRLFFGGPVVFGYSDNYTEIATYQILRYVEDIPVDILSPHRMLVGYTDSLFENYPPINELNDWNKKFIVAEDIYTIFYSSFDKTFQIPVKFYTSSALSSSIQAAYDSRLLPIRFVLDHNNQLNMNLAILYKAQVNSDYPGIIKYTPNTTVGDEKVITSWKQYIGDIYSVPFSVSNNGIFSIDDSIVESVYEIFNDDVPTTLYIDRVIKRIYLYIPNRYWSVTIPDKEEETMPEDKSSEISDEKIVTEEKFDNEKIEDDAIGDAISSGDITLQDIPKTINEFMDWLHKKRKK